MSLTVTPTGDGCRRDAPGRYTPVDISDLLLLVEKPQRYIGGERLTRARALTDRAVKWALCFPETYEIGMSHLGLKILYDILNGQDEVVADRAFAPWIDMEAAMRRRGLKLFAHESRAPLDVFDVLGFSLQSELTFVNVLTMLDLAGIPLRAADRDDSHPLVVGGGANMANPEPLAEFFDAFVIGDGEEVVLDITAAVRARRGDRGRLLEALARIRGVYVPQLYAVDYDDDGRIAGFRTLRPGIPERVERVWVEDLSAAPYPTSPVVPISEIVQDRYAIEVVRGCTQSCRFCQAGYWYRPVRERPVEQVVDLARRGVAAGGFDVVSLCSLSTADHSQVEEMARGVAGALSDDHVSIALPSLRADSFSVGLAEAAGEVKRNGFTFAPETGSERLRRVINKNITDAALLEAVETAYRRGWNLIKLYFMIGIPTETLDDVESIAGLTAKVNEVGRRVGGGKRVTASVGTHVPKAFTPFQWAAFEGIDTLREKLALLRRKLPRRRFVRLKWHELEPSYLEAVLSLGDRRLGAVIEAAWRNGARFDSWDERFDWSRWQAAFAGAGVDPERYTRGRALDEILPWDLIDAGLTKAFFKREWLKAREERLTGDCRWGDCHMCGIPDAPNDIKLSAGLPEAPGVAGKVGLDGNPIRRAGYARRGGTTPAGAGDAPAAAAAAASDDRPTAAPRGDRGAARAGRAGRASRGQREPALTVRVHFRADGACRYIPHHDLMHAFHRAVRVARAPVRFTEGFSPRPRLAFGPPLPVGIGGEREVFDIELERQVPDLVERLNAALPDGLECTDARLVAHRGPSLTARVRAADYLVELPADLRGPELEERVERFHAADSFPVTKSRPGRPDRVIDLKRGIIDLEVDGGRVALLLAVGEPGGHETRARTVLTEVLGLDREQAARVRVTRLAMEDEEGEVI